MRKERVHAEGERQPLTKELRKVALFQISGLGRMDLSAFTYEHHGTNYPEAKADLTVFDGLGNMVLRGREFGGNRVFFWDARNEALAAIPLTV